MREILPFSKNYGTLLVPTRDKDWRSPRRRSSKSILNVNVNFLHRRLPTDEVFAVEELILGWKAQPVSSEVSLQTKSAHRELE